jgi:hypothetical protein
MDAPIAQLVGVGQGAARYVAPDAHVVELGVLGAQTGLDVAQALAIGELGEGHAAVLVETTEALDPMLAPIPMNTASEGMHRQMVHELRKDELASVHATLPLGARRKRQECIHGQSQFKSMTPQDKGLHDIFHIVTQPLIGFSRTVVRMSPFLPEH